MAHRDLSLSDAISLAKHNREETGYDWEVWEGPQGCQVVRVYSKTTVNKRPSVTVNSPNYRRVFSTDEMRGES